MEDDDDGRKPSLPVVPMANSQTISLNDLLDFAIQQMVHEVTVLSELMPRKNDEQKKISLVQFAYVVRMLSVKLLGLVKWIKTSKKTDACTGIAYILDQQSEYFVATADTLFMMKNDLVLARLPAFQVCPAVDVLTQGTYPRLPLCVKERFIKKKKITPREQAMVLQRLNMVLEFRLIQVASRLSPRVKDISIRNGIVTLVVPGEFEVQLTVLGESNVLRWTLMNIKILVADYEIGYGTHLVHPLQLHMIHQVVQSRIDNADDQRLALVDVYRVLHHFAQSLQLDVLFCQASRLASMRLRNKIIIEKYDEKNRELVIGYWLQRIKNKQNAQISVSALYRVTICGDPPEMRDTDGPIRVRHSPDAPNLGKLDERTGRLSVDRLLSETMLVRCKERLLKIRKRLELSQPHAHISMTGQAIPCLTMPLLRDSCVSREEWLIVSVNMFSGRVLCHIDVLNESARKELSELELALSDVVTAESLRKMLDRLKVLLMIDRFRRAVYGLQVTRVNETEMAPMLKKVKEMSTDRICLRFTKEEHYYLVIAFEPLANLSVRMQVYLLFNSEEKTQLIPLTQAFGDVHSPMGNLIRLEESLYGEALESDDEWFGTKVRRENMTRQKNLQRALRVAVGAVDDRISFLRICDDLDRHKVAYHPLESEHHVGGLVLHIADCGSLPVFEGKHNIFFENIVSCCLRLDKSPSRKIGWPFECCMANVPLVSDIVQEKKPRPDAVSWISELNPNSSVKEGVYGFMVDQLTRYSHLFSEVIKFAQAYNARYHKQCSIYAYTYHKLILLYGEQRDQALVLTFQTKGRNVEDEKFKLCFGVMLPREKNGNPLLTAMESSRYNTHTIMSSIINTNFNKRPDLIRLVHYLVSTTRTLQALMPLTRIRFQSSKLTAQLHQIDIPYPLKLKCHLTAINETTLRLVFGVCHLELQMLEGERVAVRESARNLTCAGLHQFFIYVSGGTAEVKRDDSGVDDIREPSSLPSQGYEAASPNVGGGMPLSVPSSVMMDANATNDSKKECFTPSLRPNSAPVVIDHETLTRACRYVKTDLGGMRSPLDDYLSTISFMRRLAAAWALIETDPGSQPNPHMRSTGYPPVKQVVVMHDAIRVVVAACHTGDGPSTVILTFYLHPSTAKLVVKIEYEPGYPGIVPSESDVELLERAFAEQVVPLNNEMAVISFSQLARITIPSIVANFGQLVLLQLEPSPYSVCSLSLQYSCQLKVQDAPGQKKFEFAVFFEEKQNVLLFMVALRPNRREKMEKTILRIVYSITTHVVKLQPEADDQLSAVAAAMSGEAARNDDCPIYNFVKHIFDRYNNGQLAPGSASVGIHQPGSVGAVGSVGGQMGPGSMMNPGSIHNLESNTGM